MKNKYLLAYMDMAERFALTSEAERLKVAAMLVKNDSILSIGINGTPSGWPTNQCEDSNGDTAWFTRHAEAACLDKMLHSTETTVGGTMFVTHAPCKLCAVRLVDAKIQTVYFRHQYRDTGGVDYLATNGVVVRVL